MLINWQTAIPNRLSFSLVVSKLQRLVLNLKFVFLSFIIISVIGYKIRLKK